MSIKINGKPFDFDSRDLYAGERPPRSFSDASTFIIVSLGVIACVIWYAGAWIILFKLFNWIVPSWMAGVHL